MIMVFGSMNPHWGRQPQLRSTSFIPRFSRRVFHFIFSCFHARFGLLVSSGFDRSFLLVLRSQSRSLSRYRSTPRGSSRTNLFFFPSQLYAIFRSREKKTAAWILRGRSEVASRGVPSLFYFYLPLSFCFSSVSRISLASVLVFAICIRDPFNSILFIFGKIAH